VIDADDEPNYLMCALRELLPLATGYGRLLLAYDRELDADYRLLDRVLSQFGARVSRVVVTRVPIDGRSQSTRHGGWQRYTLGALIRRFLPAYGEADFRLGLRLYLIAGLGKGGDRSFDLDHLRRQLDRARQLRERTGAGAGGDAGELRRFLAGLAARPGYVDPYRLTSDLLARHKRVPREPLIQAVYS